MATNTTRKKCIKCKNNIGVTTCNGCRKNFCEEHLDEHEEGIIEEMDRIHEECELFRQNLPQENDPTPILSAIDTWEQELIEKIRSVAANARADVEKYTNMTLNDFNQALDKITLSIEASRDTSNAAESNLKSWNQQFESLQDLLKEPFPIGVMSDKSPSSTIHLIKVTYEPAIKKPTNSKIIPKEGSNVMLESHASFFTESKASTEEKFNRFAGHVKLSENGSVAKCVGYSSACGIKLYAKGIHRIRFRIITKKNEGIFFGILTSTQDVTPRATELPSAYGWRDFDRVIIDGDLLLNAYKDKNIQPGDQMTLIINCDNPELVLAHHRLKKKMKLSVDVSQCPLPWRLLISSFGEDTIAIMNQQTN